MPRSKKGQGVLEANRKVSHVDLSVTCNDMFDVKHDMLDVRGSPSEDNRPKFEPRCFDGNSADYPYALLSMLDHDEMSGMPTTTTTITTELNKSSVQLER
ncbi:unnamed protein product [Trichobilharzia regenti]|nr:unnamed protein product [Trichobilharzia regenti]